MKEHLSIVLGHYKTIELILQKSADCNIDLNAADLNGDTPFQLACTGCLTTEWGLYFDYGDDTVSN